MAPEKKHAHRRSKSTHQKRLNFFAYMGLALVALAIALLLWVLSFPKL